MTKTRKFAATLALACAAMTSQAAFAADISLPTETVTIEDGAGAFGRLITGNHANDTFTDKYWFDIASVSSLTANLYSNAGNEKVGLDITGFSLYSSNGTLVAGGTQVESGKFDHWTLDLSKVAAGNDYYLSVTGNVVSKAAGTYSGIVATVSAVPEPATYGMLLGGMALLGVAARRRKPQ